MSTRVFPVKNIPQDISSCGDCYITQSALMLGTMVDGEVILKNCSNSRDTEITIAFLKSLGFAISKHGREIRIGGSSSIRLPDDLNLVYEGSIYALSLIIGFLTGKSQFGTLRYSDSINQDIIDGLIDVLNEYGIDVSHQADNRTIVVRPSTGHSIEARISSSLPYLKNCLLTFGISSGHSVTIRETRISSSRFEECITRFGGRMSVTEPKPELKEDPDDPRKRIRFTQADHVRELVLSPSTELRPSAIDIPVDSDAVTALLTLAVLKKKEITLKSVALNAARIRFLNYVRSSGVEISISDRKVIDGESLASIAIQGKAFKARKISGEQASALIEEIPFMAVLAALGTGTTVIRGIKEFDEWGITPFQEISVNLEKMGIKCGILQDGLVIEGAGEIKGADFHSFRNAKIGLAFYVAALAAQGWSSFENFELIAQSYPDFVTIIQNAFSGRQPGTKNLYPV